MVVVTPSCATSCIALGRSSALVPVLHAPALRDRGSRASTATGWCHASDISACHSRSGIRSTPTANPTSIPHCTPNEDVLPIDPESDVPVGIHRRPTQSARRFHGRSRRDGHVGDELAHAADRVRMGRRSRSVRAHVPDGPASAGARHHPHVAVRHGVAFASRARRAAVDDTQRSRVGCSIPTARRCRSRRATSSRRWSGSSSTAPTALRYWAASARPGTDTDLRREPAQGRTQARDQDPERRRSSCSRRAASHRKATTGSTIRRISVRRSTGRCSPRSTRSSIEATESFEEYDYARALERTERSSGCSATTTSSS